MGFSPENAKEAIKEAEDKNLGTKINFTKPFEENNFMHHEPTIF